jgi:hypothetical protein
VFDVRLWVSWWMFIMVIGDRDWLLAADGWLL